MTKPFVLLLFFSALVCGCSESPQEKAYDQALDSERAAAQTIAAEAPALIADYTNVINLDPTTKWAKRSQNQNRSHSRGIMQDEQNEQRAKSGR